MKIRGREINFLRTVKTTCDLVELCPDKDISRINEVFNGEMDKVQRNAAILIHSLNEGYEMNKHFDNPEYEPNVISIDEIMFLDNDVFQELIKEAMEVFTAEIKSTVETEKSKKKKNSQ